MRDPSFFSLPSECRLFSRGVIFTPARVSLALLSLRENGMKMKMFSQLLLTVTVITMYRVDISRSGIRPSGSKRRCGSTRNTRLTDFLDERRRRKLIGGPGACSTLRFLRHSASLWAVSFSLDEALQIGGLFHLSISTWKVFNCY